jgi:hypothetical protein
MTLNADEDIYAFISATIANIIMVIICVCIFSYLRLKYPIVYSHNVTIGQSPPPPDDSFFGWYRASLDATTEDHIKCIGLDNAKNLKFSVFCTRVMWTCGVPMFCICGTLNLFFGGFAAGKDYMSYFSFGNVEDGSWLYWVHMVAIWGVLVTLQTNIFVEMRNFMDHRFKWLRNMPAVRANCVLVEGIPEEYRSGDKLKAYFEIVFPGKVKTAYIAKNTDQLTSYIDAYKAADAALAEANQKWEAAGSTQETRPMCFQLTKGGNVDAIEFWQAKKEEAEPALKEEKDRILKESAETVGGVNCSTGFVTFSDRLDAEMALRLDYTYDATQWMLSCPPEPDDMIWKDLTLDETKQQGKSLLGYALVAGLYFAYLPLVIGITNVAKVMDLGPLQSIWEGLAPTMGLQIMVAFLPTLLVLIFNNFFILKAAAFAQHKIQVWYFAFQVVFVILAAAVGQDCMTFTRTLFTEPTAIFGVLATTMPYSTHFFMNFMTIQWATHAMVLMRYVILSKFKLFSQLFDEAKAKQMAEPEDQDYFGIGSRMARWCITMCVCIVYGTLCPPMNILGLLTFKLMRAFYGYLIPFAETRKPDLGGVFFVTALRQLFTAQYIYVTLMAGVLWYRAASSIPGSVVSLGIVYTYFGAKKFDTSLQWEKLPITDVMAQHKNADGEMRTLSGEYT